MHTVGSLKIDRYLRENYPTTRAKVIAKELGLSAKYITQRCYKLGIKKNKPRTLKPIEPKPVERARIVITGAVTRHISF
jgi:hypothetical protein